MYLLLHLVPRWQHLDKYEGLAAKSKKSEGWRIDEARSPMLVCSVHGLRLSTSFEHDENSDLYYEIAVLGKYVYTFYPAPLLQISVTRSKHDL